MQLEDDGGETTASQVEEVVAPLQGLWFFGFIALVDRVVPNFPNEALAMLTVRVQARDTVRKARLLPLNNRAQFVGVDGVVEKAQGTRHGGQKGVGGCGRGYSAPRSMTAGRLNSRDQLTHNEQDPSANATLKTGCKMAAVLLQKMS